MNNPTNENPNIRYLNDMTRKILQGQLLTKEEVLPLMDAPLEELCGRADEIRREKRGNLFDLCTIVNGKSGRCSEDCKYCAQSARYPTGAEEYPLLSTEALLEDATRVDAKGVPRYSVVTSGRRLQKEEVDRLCDSIRRIHQDTGLSVCVSLGLLEEEDFRKLREAGAIRVHNNLESSERYFPEVCTTHSYEDKKKTIEAAKRAGMEVCSGGIMGLGETMEDRLDLVFTARDLGVTSIPVNLLNPIPGTPYENHAILTNEEMRRTVALFRFIIPDADIRLAGGRGLLPDKGRACFRSGANATITGDMLTTSGITIDQDMAMLQELGYELRKVR